MAANLKGWVYLICAAVIFAVFCWIASRHEMRLAAELKEARQEIKAMDKAHSAVLETLQQAHKAQETGK